jgi:Divergent InlB B-repeat domain
VRTADIPGSSLTAVDCVSTTLCVAINDTGSVMSSSAAGPKTLTVAKTGSGTGTVTSAPDGIACGATCSQAFEDGTAVTLTATPAAGSRFTGWSGVCSGTGTCKVELTVAQSATANFAATASLTVTKAGSGSGSVTSAPAGITCGVTCSAVYDVGTTVKLTAAAADGSSFTGWSGACSGTDTCEVSLSAAKTVTATFALRRNLNLNIDTQTGSGSGRVTSPDGINCDSYCPYGGSDGDTTTMTATPNAGSRFGGWSGGGCSGTGTCTITLNTDLDIQAMFIATPTLTVATAGTGTGSVASNTGGIDCGASCSAVYDAGSTVTLTASPAAGSTFTGWSGGGCSGTQPCKLTVTDSTTVNATFVAGPEPTPTATAVATAIPTTTPPATAQPGTKPATGSTPNQAVPDTRLVKTTIEASKRTARFTFKAVGTATSYRCALTARGKKVVYKTCRSPVTFKKLKPGRYTFRVQAAGSAGTDPTPASKTITIEK